MSPRYPAAEAHLRAWAAALRSGEYPQTHGRLFHGPATNPTGYCCLAVERAVAGASFEYDGATPQWREGEDGGGEGCIALPQVPYLFDNLNLLPTRLLPEALTFVDLNDEVVLTFPQLADVVDYCADNLYLLEASNA